MSKPTLTNQAALNAMGDAADYIIGRLRTDDVDAAKLANALSRSMAEIRDLALAGRQDDGSREPPWLDDLQPTK